MGKVGGGGHILKLLQSMNRFCFGAIYNGSLWEKELRV